LEKRLGGKVVLAEEEEGKNGKRSNRKEDGKKGTTGRSIGMNLNLKRNGRKNA